MVPGEKDYALKEAACRIMNTRLPEERKLTAAEQTTFRSPFIKMTE
jgi:hypothetical protein